jgi:hypothetical protein
LQWFAPQRKPLSHWQCESANRMGSPRPAHRTQDVVPEIKSVITSNALPGEFIRISLQ